MNPNLFFYPYKQIWNITLQHWKANCKILSKPLNLRAVKFSWIFCVKLNYKIVYCDDRTFKNGDALGKVIVLFFLAVHKVIFRSLFSFLCTDCTWMRTYYMVCDLWIVIKTAVLYKIITIVIHPLLFVYICICLYFYKLKTHFFFKCSSTCRLSTVAILLPSLTVNLFS